MILVLTGMDLDFPFDRLARAADELQRTGAAGDEVFVQLGSARYVPRHARFERFLSFGEVCERVAAASAVVTHAGAGSTLVCLQHGKRPVVVPRRADRGEVTDDHQLQLAERLGRIGLVVPVHDVEELPRAVAEARGARVAPLAPPSSRVELASWLEAYWRSVAGVGGAR